MNEGLSRGPGDQGAGLNREDGRGRWKRKSAWEEFLGLPRKGSQGPDLGQSSLSDFRGASVRPEE